VRFCAFANSSCAIIARKYRDDEGFLISRSYVSAKSLSPFSMQALMVLDSASVEGF